MRLYRLAFRILQQFAPDRAAALAERLFFTPAQSRLSPEQAEALEKATPLQLRVAGRPVMAWTWGYGPPVYLVHGWGSRGARLSAFVAPLVAAGYRVVTHDAPGQGASDPGLTSMPEFARSLRAVVEAVGPAHGVIAHSMGASATALAMTQGLVVPRAVFLAPAANPAHFVTPFASALGLTEEVVRRMREASERRIGHSWENLDVPTMARGLGVPLLVFHDRGDEVVRWRDGAAIASAWDGAELVSTEGLGHRGVIRDPAVIARAVEFVKGNPDHLPGVPGNGISQVEPGWSASALERELFAPEERRTLANAR